MINLKKLKIGRTEKPFIIAEMSGNHNQSLERALSIVDAAADAGAHAIKLQTYTADTMTLDLKDGEFFIDGGGLILVASWWSILCSCWWLFLFMERRGLIIPNDQNEISLRT